MNLRGVSFFDAVKSLISGKAGLRFLVFSGESIEDYCKNSLKQM